MNKQEIINRISRTFGIEPQVFFQTVPTVAALQNMAAIGTFEQRKEMVDLLTEAQAATFSELNSKFGLFSDNKAEDNRDLGNPGNDLSESGSADDNDNNDNAGNKGGGSGNDDGEPEPSNDKDLAKMMREAQEKPQTPEDVLKSMVESLKKQGMGGDQNEPAGQSEGGEGDESEGKGGGNKKGSEKGNQKGKGSQGDKGDQSGENCEGGEGDESEGKGGGNKKGTGKGNQKGKDSKGDKGDESGEGGGKGEGDEGDEGSESDEGDGAGNQGENKDDSGKKNKEDEEKQKGLPYFAFKENFVWLLKGEKIRGWQYKSGDDLYQIFYPERPSDMWLNAQVITDVSKPAEKIESEKFENTSQGMAKAISWLQEKIAYHNQ